MKKTIKFRAWDEGNQQMLYFAEAEKLMEYAGVFFRIIKPVKFPCDFADLMQWTGLKDKNGKEIWENDLVEREGEIGEVRYDDLLARFRVYIDNNKPMPRNYPLWSELLKVIGNIHENSELINPPETL